MAKPWTHPVGVLLLALVAQGCTTMSGPGKDAPSADAAARAGDTAARVADFLADASVGQSARLASAKAGGDIRLTVQDEYHAASGRLCRELVMTNGVGPPEPRVACRDEEGAWHLLPRLRNRELPSVSGLR